VFDELRALTAGTPADLSGISYDRLEAERAVRWPAPSPEAEGGYRYVDNDGWSFPTPSGRARFSTGAHDGLAEPTDDEFPLTLTTGRQADAYNTGVRSRGTRTDDPDGADPPGDDAGVHRVVRSREDGRLVAAGSVTIAVNPDDGVPKGMVWLPIHHPAVNALTLPVVDPESDEPNLKQCAVDVRRAAAVEPVGPRGPAHRGRRARTDGRLMACRRRLAGLGERRPARPQYTPWLFMRKRIMPDERKRSQVEPRTAHE